MYTSRRVSCVNSHAALRASCGHCGPGKGVGGSTLHKAEIASKFDIESIFVSRALTFFGALNSTPSFHTAGGRWLSAG